MAHITEDSLALKQLIVEKTEVEAGRTGRNAYFGVKTNVKMGGWFNASKSYLDLDASGSASGLMSAHNMELRLPTTPPAGGSGSYCCAEHELVCQASGTTGGVPVAMGWYQVSGDSTSVTDWENTGYFMVLKGFTAGNDKIFATVGDVAAAGTLKILIGTTTYYLMIAAGTS